MAREEDLSSVTGGTTYDDFETGDEERIASLSAARTIYGRGAETHTLHKTYQRLLAAKQAQFVVIHGESGAGKTALVETLMGPVFDTSGYFMAGKYFQQKDTSTECEPCSAIMAAFSDLCDLVVQSHDFDDDCQ
jgi:ABC-type phosphate/phosphonate transport system ATPase subunit